MAASERDSGRVPNPAENHNLEIDPDARAPSERTSTGSSVLDEGAIAELGRTYHHYKPDSYLLPNDADEQNRLDLQHKVMLLLMDDRLHWAPLQAPKLKRALDVGTGTGIWALELAKLYPHCEVTGSDLSLIQPKDVLPNCFFVREDADDEWLHSGLFDYVHFRLFCPFIKSIRAVVEKATNVLQPGGWLEFQEVTHEIESSDGSHEGTALQKAIRVLSSVNAANGRNSWAVTHLKHILTEMGFVNIVEKVLPVPIGPWAMDEKYKEIGWWNGVNTHGFLDSLIKLLLKSGMDIDQANELIEAAKDEIYRGVSHPHVSLYIVYARKPKSV